MDLRTSVAATQIHVAPGIHLSDRQRLLVGICLDLFCGRCSLYRLSHFTEDAVYLDAFADAKDRKEIGGQMFGLPIVTQSSVTLEHLVLSAEENEVTCRMIQDFHFAKLFLAGKSIKYSTVIHIITNSEGQITKLSDRPEVTVPDGPLSKLLRNLNAKMGPTALGIPETDEEDEKWWSKHVLDRPEQDERERAQGGASGKAATEPSKRG